MILIEDSRNKIGKHNNIFKYCKEHDIEIQRKVLNVGDYMLPQGTIAVDTKQSLSELANDLYTDKLAFNKKYKKCLKDGIKLIVLVEEKVNNLNELVAWKSKHSRINGRLLLDMIHTIQVSYGVKFVFCDKNDTPIKLLELLGAKIMNELKTIKLNELNTDETTKELLTGLLNANFNIYFALITDNYTTKEKKLSTWFHYGKDGVFAYYGRSASWDWLKETGTVHKPNTKTGSGWQVLEKSTITLDDLFFTYQKSCDNINKGREQKFDKLGDELKFWDVIQVVKG